MITGGMTLTGENQSKQRNTCSSVTLSTTNPTRAGLGLNLDLCGEKLGTNHLSHRVNSEVA